MGLLALAVDDSHCVAGVTVHPSAGLPVDGLFPEVAELYDICGGIDFFPGAEHPMQVVGPDGYVRTNRVVLGDDVTDDRSHQWFRFAGFGTQHISVDTAPERRGLVYDSFVDTHGVAGSCPVIASSITEFLERTLHAAGGYPYWLRPGFVELGDAYD